MRVTIAWHEKHGLLECHARLAAELGLTDILSEYGRVVTVTAVTALAHLCMTSQVFEKLCLVAAARVASASSRCLCEWGSPV